MDKEKKKQIFELEYTLGLIEKDLSDSKFFKRWCALLIIFTIFMNIVFSAGVFFNILSCILLIGSAIKILIEIAFEKEVFEMQESVIKKLKELKKPQ